MSEKYRNRIARLEREAAPRVKPLRLGPSERMDQVSPALRAATLAQLGAELLFGVPREAGPFPSVGLHPRAADLYRHKALGTAHWEDLERQVAADPQAGARFFGADWPHVAPVFGFAAPKRTARVQLEATDYAAWKRERWAALLASDEGKALVESGRLVPARGAASNGGDAA